MFILLKKAFSSVYEQVTSKLRTLFNQPTIDQDTLKELEKILIEADTGIHTTRGILKELQSAVAQGTLTQGKDLEQALKEQLSQRLQTHPYNPEADVYLLVGINGSGKTTFAAKLANLKNKPLLVAADTFRAAATEQLAQWATQLSADLITGSENQDLTRGDPASVVYKGCEKYLKGGYDVLIIDTAGRLQTKVNLMKELEKIRKIITKQLPNKKVSVLLTIDAMLGQNSFDQAKLFKESTNVDGIVLTKMDGTGKGGIVFSITEQLQLPIAYISFGEKLDQLATFNPDDYLTTLLG